MKSPVSFKPSVSVELTADPLFKLQRRIARRADQLARKIGPGTGHSIVPWEMAEREIWAEAEAHPATTH